MNENQYMYRICGKKEKPFYHVDNIKVDLFR